MNKTDLPLNLWVKRHFTDMNFYYLEPALGPKKKTWLLVVYILFSLGIFARQITQFPKVNLNFDNIKWSVLIASFIFGLAILPYIMRWISRRSKGKPTIEHIISSFGFGFFLDLINKNVTDTIIKFFS